MTISWTSPFLEPNDPSLRAMLGDAAVHLLADRGVGDLSSRAIAGYLGTTPSALTQRAHREQQLQLMVVALGQRWLDWSGCRPETGLPARLPGSADEVHGLRVWAALTELARGEAAAGNPEPARLIAGYRAEERAMIDWSLMRILDRRPGPEELAVTAAIVAGLREELVAPSPALTADAASAALRGHVDRLRSAQAA